MKKKYTIISAIHCLAIGVFITACSDWTDVENVSIQEPGIGEDSPELYAKYLENLRTYKNSDHKAMYVAFDNSEKVPFSRGQHMIDLPDSVDVISLMYPAGLAEFEIQEMEKLQSQKGTKVVYAISYEKIEKSYTEMVKENLEQNENYTAPPFTDYLKSSVETELTPVNTYQYDGIIVGYNGKSTLHMTDEEKALYLSYQKEYFNLITSWMNSHKDKFVSFNGSPQYLQEKTFLNSCKHIILNTENVTTAAKLSVNAELAAVSDVPAKFAIAVNMTDPDDKTIGLYDDGTLRATTEAAYWTVSQTGNYAKTGMLIYNVQNDYYNASNIYQYTREAINIMNPAPKK